MTANRVIVIGVDAATLRIVRPMAEAGMLPTMRRFLERGAFGVLQSTLPAVSPAAWSTFATGTNPGKHGLLTFAQMYADGYDARFTNATHRRGVTFWEVAGEHGVRGGIINIPCTFPPRPFNGFMITCMLSPGVNPRMASPPEVFDDLIAASPDYQVDVNIADRLRPGARAIFMERALANVEGRRRAALGLYRKHRPQLFCVAFTATDRVSHYFLPDDGAPHDAPEIREIYSRTDAAIGEILHEVGDEADVILISDHGAMPIRACLSMRRVLARANLLVEHRPSGLRRALQRGLLRFARTVPKTLQQRIINRFRGASRWAVSRITSGGIDFSRTRAYPAEALEGVFINLRGRQPQGMVEPGAEYERLRDEVIAIFRELKDPQTCRPVFKGVFRREEVWSGPCLHLLPDVVMEQADWCYDTKPTSSVLCTDVFSPRQGEGEQGLYDTGRHSRDGLVMALGPHIRPGEVRGAEIADVPATVLALLGCPIPEDFDGRVLTEMLTPDVTAVGGARTAEAAQERRDFTPEEQEILEKRLRGLGYL